MPVKIYIASSFDLESRVVKVVEALEKHGHKIMVKWWLNKELRNQRDVLTKEEFYSTPQCKILFDRDKFGVDNADVLVLVSSEEIKPLGGALVELGMAIERNIPCVCMGNLKNSAMYYPVYWVNSISELIKLISDLKDVYDIA